MMRVGLVKDRQTEPIGKPDLVKGFHQFNEIRRGEDRFWARSQRTQIHQRLVDAAQAAGVGQLCQRGFAGRQIEMPVRTQSDEFTRANDLKFKWHIKDGTAI